MQFNIDFQDYFFIMEPEGDSMLLAVDIGNTNVTIGLYDDTELIFLTRLATDTRRTSAQYASELNQIAALERISLSCVTGAIVSSVVPELTDVIVQAIHMLTGTCAKVLGPGLKSGLNIKIDNPLQLGADLVAGAVAAVNHYEMPCLVIDLGTATKISVLDRLGRYRGCTISAGVGVSLDALALSAAQLPTVNLDVSACPAFGTNTVASMQAGILLGTYKHLSDIGSTKAVKEIRYRNPRIAIYHLDLFHFKAFSHSL